MNLAELNDYIGSMGSEQAANDTTWVCERMGEELQVHALAAAAVLADEVGGSLSTLYELQRTYINHYLSTLEHSHSLNNN